MGSSIFFAMRRLKLASTAKASFPSMPLTERINRENVFDYHVSAYHAYPLILSPTEPGAPVLAHIYNF